MEQLPKSAKAVMGVYATAATLTQGAVAYFGFNREDFVLIMIGILLATLVGTLVYARLYFKHYGYKYENGVIIIKKVPSLRKGTLYMLIRLAV